MIQAVIGIAIGLAIGKVGPAIELDSEVAAAILMISIDSILGSISAKMEASFDDKVMLSGFAINLIAALVLIGLGKYIGISLYFLVLVALGVRIFKNLSKIRQQLAKNL